MQKYIITIETDDKDNSIDFLKSRDMRRALDDVWMEVFRPNFKHGYSNPVLNSDEAYDIIEALSELYRQKLTDYDVDIMSY